MADLDAALPTGFERWAFLGDIREPGFGVRMVAFINLEPAQADIESARTPANAVSLDRRCTEVWWPLYGRSA